MLCLGLSSCAQDAPDDDKCYIRVGNEYCLQKGSLITVHSSNNHGDVGQVLEYPHFTGGTGEIEISYTENSVTGTCSVQGSDVILELGTLVAKCIDCKSWFEQFPTNYAGEISTLQGTPLFAPCHKKFGAEATDEN